MEFHFNAQGEITRIYTDGRYYEKEGNYTLVPWQGYFRTYDERNGMRIPLEGKVEWILPEGELVYWRGSIKGVELH